MELNKSLVVVDINGLEWYILTTFCKIVKIQIRSKCCLF